MIELDHVASDVSAAGLPRALVATPNPPGVEGLYAALARLGFEAVTAESPADAMMRFHSRRHSLVFLDSALANFVELVRQFRARRDGVPIVALAPPDPKSLKDAFRAGASDVVAPFGTVDEFAQVIGEVSEATRAPWGDDAAPADDGVRFFADYADLFRRSAAMRAVGDVVARVATTNVLTLIEGETGTGKELIARAIHYLSDRAANPFIKVNCASLPAELLESELFGYEKGAFTGAIARKPGRFELAHTGTLFLDEIGELPLQLQAKLLHVLQDNQFFRVGGRESITADVRIVTATNRTLRRMVESGTFREDLYYRLDVLGLKVPPLRERPEEIPGLVDHFRDRFAQEFDRPALPPASSTLELLTRYDWPGNVRELENLIKRYVALGDERQLRDELTLRIRLSAARAAATTEPAVAPEPSTARTNLHEIAGRAAGAAERAAIRAVLEQVRWNRAEAARRLGISYKTLLRKLRADGVPPKRRATS